MVQLKAEAEDAVVAERRQALEAEKAAKARELKKRAEIARQRVLEQVSTTLHTATVYLPGVTGVEFRVDEV